ncbi:response regulator [Archangium violaceum]|uniref:response regulator n=1 Tax=Archangium violaceum TaxID=83451 RepID=UPI002B321CED|nr:response regulator [Archangium gephyra]
MQASTVNQQGASSRAGRAMFRGESRKRPVAFHGQVLLIENLKERRHLMCDMLAHERFEVGVVEDAREAIQLLAGELLSGQRQVPELILCNARMLGDAGLAALERLCASNPDVPVILYSPFTNPRLREQIARIPGAWFMDHSARLEDLRSTVVSLASSRQTSV